MSTFQLIVISIFVSFIIIGVGTFALFGGAFGGGGVGTVTIWGTESQGTMEFVLETMHGSDKSFENVHYIEQDPAAYEGMLLNAMASGSAPDLFMVTQEQLGGFSDKVVIIPYGTVSQSEFVSSYIDEGQLFLTPQGSFALPFSIDPMVMYWNRDFFASAGVAQAPQYWNDFLTLAPKMYSANASQNITRTAVALGSWSNILHAKEILSTLFMQAGEFVTKKNTQGAIVPVFGQSGTGGNSPAESALRFYTEFSNPGRSNYSWNRALPRSDQAFVGGQLGVYFGFASEYASLAARNPNLRFGVAVMPQLQGSGGRLTYGVLTGLSIPKAAKNIQGAALIAQKLTGVQAATLLAQQTNLPSVRRDVSLDTAASTVADIFVQSALMSYGWIDPGHVATDKVFLDMIESVVSGRGDPATAVSEASQEFVRLIPVTY